MKLRILIALVALVAMCLVAGGAFAGPIRNRIDNTHERRVERQPQRGTSSQSASAPQMSAPIRSAPGMGAHTAAPVFAGGSGCMNGVCAPASSGRPRLFPLPVK